MPRTVSPKCGNRMAAIDRERRKSGFDFLLLSDPVTISYACGFASSNAMVLLGKQRRLLFSDFRYKQSAEQFCRENRGWKFILLKEPFGVELVPHIPVGSHIGFQSDRMVVDEFTRLKKRLRGRRFSGCGELLDPLFMVKNPTELTAMRKAARIGDRAFKLLLPHIVPGVTELELARLLEGYCRDLGSQKPSFATIVLFGARSALPHGMPGTTRLRNGMFVLIDFGCTIDGFASDMTRTVVCGKASDRQRELYGIVLNAQLRARKSARAGMAANAIDSLARTPIEQAGFSTEFGHALGHGVGRWIHESPRVSSRVTARIPAGTVITIEPGVYLPGFGGVRIEDMVILRENGNSLLTHSSRELLEL